MRRGTQIPQNEGADSQIWTRDYEDWYRH